MAIDKNIQSFLIRKFDEHKIKRKDFARESGISLPTLCQLLNAGRSNPELKTLMKLASYFNCSLDEVVGRDNFIPPLKTSFKEISLEDASNSLKRFMQDKIKETGLNIYQLGKKCGFSERAFFDFVKEDGAKGAKNVLGSAMIIGFADYFNVSLDEMIGRTTFSAEKSEELTKITTQSKEHLPTSLKDLKLEDLEALNQIKDSILTNQKQTTIPTTNPVKSKRNTKLSHSLNK